MEVGLDGESEICFRASFLKAFYSECILMIYDLCILKF